MASYRGTGGPVRTRGPKPQSSGPHPYPSGFTPTARYPLLWDGGYFAQELRTRSGDASLELFAKQDSDQLRPELRRLVEQTKPKVARSLPLSDVRLFGFDTEDFVAFNTSIRPEQFNQYFLGVGWENVQSVLGLRAVLPAISKLDAIIHYYRLYPSQPTIPPRQPIPPPVPLAFLNIVRPPR